MDKLMVILLNDIKSEKNHKHAYNVYESVHQSVLLAALILDELEGRGQMVLRDGG